MLDAKQKHPHECSMFTISSFYFLMSGILLMSTKAASFLKSAVTIKSYFTATRVKQTQSIIQYCQYSYMFMGIFTASVSLDNSVEEKNNIEQFGFKTADKS